ncbi:MAG TPA: polysaccharide ABC transporter ATP-binding protein [Thermomicrobiales bacterium]|nr:polysaccharide ABC transporter ATP-binding protein [Thermomicrobiales bacterium]
MATRHGDYAIEFRDVSRRFVLHHERRASFQDWFVGLIRPRGIAEEFWALRNISFGIRRGETIGIIGRNGAGKSTLLKLVTRILEPSHGSVIVNGRTYAMLELGSGFHPELTGRDNIFLNGSLYGFSRKQMSQRYDDIVRFAELERFVDTPVKHYSSGMYARLGFGIAVNMDPEILVIDEVLAVGDATFQAKCFRALERLKERGTTILFVSHDADSVRRFCDRAALISAGLLEDIGPSNEVVDHYERQLAEGTPQARLLRVRAAGPDGTSLDSIESGSDVRIDVLMRVPENTSTTGLALRLDLRDDAGTHLFSATTLLPELLPPAANASQRPDDAPDTRVATGSIRRLPLAGGTLHVVATLLTDHLDMATSLDRQETVVRVAPAEPGQPGLLALDHCWSWDGDAEANRT